MENGQQLSSQSTSTSALFSTSTSTSTSTSNSTSSENSDNNSVKIISDKSNSATSKPSSPSKSTKPRRFVKQPLQRNQACSTCRSRKVRCDALRPGCGACRRSATAHGEDPNLVICHYERPCEKNIFGDNVSTNQLKTTSPRIAALEREIAEVERLISQFNLQPQAPCSSISPEPLQPSISTGPSPSFTFSNPSELIWSNWPNCLPPRRIVAHLIKLYLTSQSCAGQEMFAEPTRLLANLHLPSNHPDFPFIGLLHVIMGLAYRQSVSGDPDQFALNLLRVCNIKRYWPMEASVHRYHADRAKSWIEQALYNGTNLFQLTQALNIYCHYAYETVQLVPAWICSGLAIRFSTPLGLNQLEKSIEHLEGTKPKPKSLLPEPSTVVEKYARAVTFWLAFQMDRFLSVSAGRPHSISEADITSLLPAKPGSSQATIGTVDLFSNPLSLSHPDFFSSHPYDADDFQLEMKATILLGRVSDWLIRAPDPVGFNLRKYWQMPDGPIPDLRSQGDFMQLDQDINAFQASLNPKLFQAIFEEEGRKVSHRKVMIILILNLSIILLHECFITKDPSSLSFQQCLQATSKIKFVCNSLSGAGYDHRFLHPFSHYCWAIAVRMMMRQLVQSEIRLIELATTSTTQTEVLSTCWIHSSFPAEYQQGAPEEGYNEMLARLLKSQQDQVDQNLMEIEALLKFNTVNRFQHPDMNAHSHTSLDLGPNPQKQQTMENTYQYSINQGLGGGNGEGLSCTIDGFSNGVDGLPELDSIGTRSHTHQTKFGFNCDHHQDQIKGLSQVYFDQMIKLFHIRFQAFRLPQSLSGIVLS